MFSLCCVDVRFALRPISRLWLALAIGLLTLHAPCEASDARSYAIIIGISNYKDSYWPRLPNGRPDAEQMGAMLARQGFLVRSFLDQDAIVARIDAYIEDELAPRLQSGDRVLFFFSGHGQTRTVGLLDFGYVIPYDATAAASTWISMDKIREYSAVLNSARHQLFVLDSCFSGLLISRGAVLSPLTPNYIDQLNRRVARTVITAGGKDQKVADSGYAHMSLFTYELMRALQDGLADVRHDGFITVNDIFSFVLRAAANGNQTPSLGTLPGDEAGEMVFASPKSTYSAKLDEAPMPSAGVTRGATDPDVPKRPGTSILGSIRVGSTSDDPDSLGSRVTERLNAALREDDSLRNLHAVVDITFRENVNRRSLGDPRIFGSWLLVVPDRPGCTLDTEAQWFGRGGYGSLGSALDEAVAIGVQRLLPHIKSAILGPSPRC